MQADHEHKQYQTEILNKRKDICGGCKAEMTGNNAGEKHKGDSEGDASELNFTQKNADCDYKSVEHRYVRYRISGGE